MDKKRKSVPESDESAASLQLSKQQKLEEENLQQELEQFQQEAGVDEVQEEEDNDVENGDVGDEQEHKEEEEDDDDDDDDEPIQKLLEPFTKEQLIDLLSKAAEAHSDVVSQIKKVANEDIVHRKIFVHGFGWDSTTDTLRNTFSEYGEIEDCKAVTDKASGKSKGYGFILFKTRAGARRALKQPQKKIGSRMTSCQLASVGPGPSSNSAPQTPFQQPASEYTQRKIYVSNVSAELDPQKLTAFFQKYGEIEEGPLGLDKVTGKPKGFCLFVYKSLESAKKALEEPHKQFEGTVLHCGKAIDGPKSSKLGFIKQPRGQHNQYGGRNANNPNFAGAIGGAPAAGLMGQSVAVSGVPYNQGGAAASGLNPALGQALTALLTSQGAGLGLNNLLGTLGSGIAAPAVGAAQGMQGAYGNQVVTGAGVNPGAALMGGYGYGTQGGMQGAYPNPQMGQGGAGRSQHGHMGGVAPYNSH